MRRILYVILIASITIGCSHDERKISFQQNGLKIDSRYEDGMKNGEEYVYDSLGVMIAKNSYLNDTLTERVTFYRDKKPKRIETFRRGILNGNVIEFYSNGNVKGKGNYRMGKPSGLFFQYDETDSGRVLREAYFVNVQGKSEQYYRKRFDAIGHAQDEYRAIDITITPKHPLVGDSIIVEFAFKTDVKYDVANIIMGDFDQEFNTHYALDTLRMYNGKTTYKFIANAPGVKYLRGKFNIYRKDVHRDSTIEYSSERYFEEEIVVKKN